MHSSDDSIESLRQQVNAATTTLAAKRMLDKDATRALAWILQHSAAQACASLQQQQQRLVVVRNVQASSITNISHGSDDDDERVVVLPIQIDGTISQELNPLQFSYPFVVAPYKCGEIAEYHLSATCAVGVFNLALAIHNQVYKMSSSKKEEGERKEILGHCKHLYLQAHELLNHLEMDPHGTLIQVFLACSNNLSEVFHQLQDAQAAKEWQYTLCECLCTIPPASTSPVYVHFCNVCRVYNVSVDDER